MQSGSCFSSSRGVNPYSDSPTSGLRKPNQASKSPRLKASITIRTTSTFSCDIAYSSSSIDSRSESLPHSDHVAIGILEEGSLDSARQSADAVHVHAALREFFHLALEVLDLERGHRTINRLHRPLEDRNPSTAPVPVAHGFLHFGLHNQAEPALIEPPGTL